MRAGEAGTGSQVPVFPQVGDHLALDLLNTEAWSHGTVVDGWASDRDVLQWLVQQGIAGARAKAPRDLLTHARGMRSAIREAISARKAGRPVPVDALNGYLQACPTTLRMERGQAGALLLDREAHGDAVATMLGPVAEAAARLLVEDDFSVVRQCEHPDCILWFYDRTKSHRRRWCSMARCGNRQKAARFRKRSGAG